MTAKETLNRVIDQVVVNVPPNYRNDFQNKRPDCGPYIICLQAMEEYAAQQVQEMKEELGNAVSLLLRCNRVRLPEVLQEHINEFLTSKQQS